MSDRYQRVQLLLAQKRYDMAERDLRSMLAEEPRDAVAHALLALCIVNNADRMLEATEVAQSGVGIEPDEPLTHYALAVCYLRRNHNDEAAAAIEESLRLDPYDADAFAILAQSNLSRQQYQAALEAANRGLSVDPEHIDCGNMRSIALERLGRGEEAVEAASQTLRRDPDDPMSHAAHGFTLLNAGRYQEAQVAFREALRLDPHNEMARVGLINALNNRSFVFRIVHKFYVSLSRLNSKAAFGLIIGAWLLVQVLSALAGRVPVLRPLIIPIVILYVMFVVLTWIANPLFNTFLRFHPFGQHLLDRSQRWASNLIAPCLLLSVFSFGAGLYFQDLVLAILGAAYWLGMAIPIAATFAMADPARRWLVGGATVVIALLPVVGAVRAVSGDSIEPFYASFQWFGYSMLAVQFGSNFLAARPVRR